MKLLTKEQQDIYVKYGPIRTVVHVILHNRIALVGSLILLTSAAVIVGENHWWLGAAVVLVAGWLLIGILKRLRLLLRKFDRWLER